jgi:hypothetical protein
MKDLERDVSGSAPPPGPGASVSVRDDRREYHSCRQGEAYGQPHERLVTTRSTGTYRYWHAVLERCAIVIPRHGVGREDHITTATRSRDPLVDRHARDFGGAPPCRRSEVVPKSPARKHA